MFAEKSRHWLLRTVSAGSLAVLLGTAALAQAQQTYAFNMPQQPLASSLRDFARISGRQIIFTEDLVSGLSGRPLQGQLSANDALGQLLTGTGLVVEYSASGAIMIRRERAAQATPGTPVAASASASASVGQIEQFETVAVTGSRIIADAANSPTPLTVVSTLQLQETTPTNIPDGLNKLPVFQGSSRPGSAGNGGTSAGINVLALRGFGAQRTLVLLDGHRLAPTNANGTVAIDTLPQMLVSRVDVVTGGASAVYGSDAVTGVVNFVLDKRYQGLKFNVNSGISNYGDSASYKAELAFGTPLFGGRGHFLGSVEYLNRDGIPQSARPYGDEYWSQTGAGTAANPRVFTKNIRNSTASEGGLITCTACTANQYHFVGNGVIAPFVHGTPTGTAGVESGGDGGYGPFGTAITPYRNAAAFARFSYKLTDTIEFYAQATGAESWATGTWYPTNMITGANRANTFYADNPFLSPELQARINPANTPGKTFQLTKFINQFGREGSPGTVNVNRYLSAAAGLSGVLGEFVWDVYYTHGESRQSVTNYRNPNNQRWYAAEDAVRDGSGNIVCYVSTTQYANLFPGCKPMNPFGTTSMSQESYDYISSDTQYIMTNVMDDVSGSISGEVFQLPAGPLKAAVSAEMRWLEYGVTSNASPLDKVNCTGLRLCSTANALWQQDTVNGLPAVSNNVWEIALELGAPLLKDLPLIQSLDLNAGVRHTDYSTSGTVQTWKVGLDYHVNEEVRFRATTSVDIRAPTLNDLFSPVQSSITSFTDLLTGGYGIIPVTRQGNANLKPEVARTYTAGIVLTPSWLEGLTLSYDYYKITIKNGIGALTAANNEIQRLCVNSGGSSPYCSLYARPFPYSNTTPANYPTEIFNQSLNAAYQGIEGSDVEVNYHFDLADVSSNLPGNMDFRLLANMQPVDSSQQFTGAVFTYATTPRGNVSATVSYNLGDWRFSLMDRWVSSYRLANTSTYVITPSRIGSQNYVDFAMQKRFSMDGGNYTAYLSIQNVLDTHTPLHPGGSGSPGLTYPTAQRGDIVGRYFTIGLRGNL